MTRRILVRLPSEAWQRTAGCLSALAGHVAGAGAGVLLPAFADRLVVVGVRGLIIPVVALHVAGYMSNFETEKGDVTLTGVVIVIFPSTVLAAHNLENEELLVGALVATAGAGAGAGAATVAGAVAATVAGAVAATVARTLLLETAP